MMGWTPLLVAAGEGHVDTVNLLLEAGCVTDLATVDRGIPPMHLAAQNNHLKVVEALRQGLTGTRAPAWEPHRCTSQLIKAMSRWCRC